MFATWCSRIPDIKTRLALNDAQLGTLLLLLPIGQFLSILPNGLAVKHFGSRKTLITAGFLYPLALMLLGLATSIHQLALLLFFTGAIANLSNTAANTQGILLEQRYGRSIMALFHGMWSVAGFVAIGLALIFAQFAIAPTLHFTIVAITAALLLCFSGGALADDPPSSSQHNTPSTQRRWFADWHFTATIIWLGVACFGCMACEGAIYDWSSIYLRDVLAIQPTYQNFAYFAYLCTMVPGRFIIDNLVNRFGIFRILFCCAVAITIGFLTVVLCPLLTSPLSFILSLLGFALIGCGTSAIVPLCCGLAGTCKEISPGIAIAEVSTIGFFGFLITPPLIGYIAKALNLQVAFLLMFVLSLPVMVAIAMLHQKQTR